MKRVAVIAHAGKSLGGGLPELRKEIESHGAEIVFWREVAKSRFAPKQAKRVLKEDVDVIFVWGGGGMVQQCIDVVAGTDGKIAIVPAGTANLLATNLGIPTDIGAAVEIGLAGNLRALDVGRVNGEHFAVMAGAGFDARMIGDADGGLKDRVGRLAYIWTGAKNIRQKPFGAKISVDGAKWFDGEASCILLGNVGKLFGGVEAFEEARPDDGLLELGVVTAEGVREWAGTMVRAVVGTASRSPHAQTTKARSVRIKMDRKVPYEIDGGERRKVRRRVVRR